MPNKSLVRYGGWLAVLAVVFLLGVSAGVDYRSQRSLSVPTEQSQPTASLMIDYGNGKVRTFGDLHGVTVFDILKQASDMSAITLKYKEYGGEMGIFIESIDGIGEDPAGKKWWQYWVNNTYGQRGASTYTIKSGDVIEFKFIEGQE